MKRSARALLATIAIVAGLILGGHELAAMSRGLTPNVGQHIHVAIANHPVDGFPIPRVRTTYRITVTLHNQSGRVTWLRLQNKSGADFGLYRFDGLSGRPAPLGPCADCSVTFDYAVDWSRWAAGRYELRWTANVASNDDGQRQFNTSRSQVCLATCTNHDGRPTPFNGAGSWYLGDYATVYDLSGDTAHRPGGSVVVRAAQDATSACAFLNPRFHDASSGTRLGCWSGQSNHTVAIPSSAVAGDRLVLMGSQANGNAGLFAVTLGTGATRATTTYEYQSWWAKGGIVLP